MRSRVRSLPRARPASQRRVRGRQLGAAARFHRRSHSVRSKASLRVSTTRLPSRGALRAPARFRSRRGRRPPAAPPRRSGARGARACSSLLSPLPSSQRGETCVQPRPPRLRQAAVSDLARKRVLDRVLTLARQRRSERVGERSPAPRAVRSRARAAEQLVDRAGPEDAADDRRRLERSLLGRRQQVDAGGEDRLNRVRDLESRRQLSAGPGAASSLAARRDRSASPTAPRRRTGCPPPARPRAFAHDGGSSTPSSSSTSSPATAAGAPRAESDASGSPPSRAGARAAPAAPSRARAAAPPPAPRAESSRSSSSSRPSADPRQARPRAARERARRETPPRRRADARAPRAGAVPRRGSRPSVKPRYRAVAEPLAATARADRRRACRSARAGSPPSGQYAMPVPVREAAAGALEGLGSCAASHAQSSRTSRVLPDAGVADDGHESWPFVRATRS